MYLLYLAASMITQFAKCFEVMRSLVKPAASFKINSTKYFSLHSVSSPWKSLEDVVEKERNSETLTAKLSDFFTGHKCDANIGILTRSERWC